MHKKLSRYTLLSVLIAGLLSLAACGSRPGQVAGTVTDGQSGQALAQMRIVVYGLGKAADVTNVDAYLKGDVVQEQATGEDGRYSISLDPGAYIVQVWANDQKVGDRLVKIQAGRAETADFQVEMPAP
jgi:hypothetical protein